MLMVISPAEDPRLRNTAGHPARHPAAVPRPFPGIDPAAARAESGADQRVDARVRQDRWPQCRAFRQLERPAFAPENAEQALLAFKGDVYTGLDAQSFSEAQFDYAQTPAHALRPLWPAAAAGPDATRYRLEMGTETGQRPWQGSVSRSAALRSQRVARTKRWPEQGDDVLLNLASNEYFSAVKRSALKARIINTEFKDQKNGQYKIISFYAKKAARPDEPFCD